MQKKLDIVFQTTGFHGWNIHLGWLEAARKLNVLHRAFFPQGKWGEYHSFKDDGLYEYLKAPQADIIFLIGFDWHSQALHHEAHWKERWQQSPIFKVLFIHETLYDYMLPAFYSACSCVNGIVYADYQEKDLLKKSGKPAHWMPLGVDTHTFSAKKPFKRRKKTPFFRGKIQGWDSSNSYRTRYSIIKALQERHPLRLLPFKEGFPIRKLVKDYNNHQIALNFPSNFRGHPCRVYEALSCGCLVITNRIGIPEEDHLFEHQKHLLYYKDLDTLLEILKELQNKKFPTQELATSGLAFVQQEFPLEKNLLKILSLF